MRGLVFIVFLFACHREAKLDLQVDRTEQENSAKTTDEARAETRKQDPTDVDTKTTKSDNAVIVEEPDGTSTVAVVPRDRPLVLKKGAKVVGIVSVAQTVVDQSKRIGAATTEKTAQKKSTEVGDSTANTKTGVESETENDVGFSLKFYLLAGGVLAAVVALGVFLAHSKLVRHILGAP